MTPKMQPGYAFLPAHVMAIMPHLKESGVRVAVGLAAFMDGNGECYPTRAQLAEKGGLSSLASVTEGSRKLAIAGVLRTQRRPNTSNRYAWTDPAESRPNLPTGKSAKLTFQKSGKSVSPTAGKSVSPTPNIPTEHSHSSVCEAAPVPRELVGLELYEVDAKLIVRWPSLLKAWRQAYPAVDIPGEVRRAHAWEVANPTKRKTNRPRFLGSWISRAQDQVGQRRIRDGGDRKSGRRFDAADEQPGKFNGVGTRVRV